MSYAERYHSERKAFFARLRAWLDTPDGAAYKAAIERAEHTEEPEYTLAVDGAWDVAEVAFEHACPDQAMHYPDRTVTP